MGARAQDWGMLGVSFSIAIVNTHKYVQPLTTAAEVPINAIASFSLLLIKPVLPNARESALKQISTQKVCKLFVMVRLHQLRDCQNTPISRGKTVPHKPTTTGQN